MNGTNERTNRPNPAEQQAAAAQLRKDQQRAIWAYEKAQEAAKARVLREYQIAVQTFAATTLRNGLAVAISVLQRDAQRAAPALLLAHLAQRNGSTAATWPSQVRGITVLSDYMLVTRESIALATWLRRACRAGLAMADDRTGRQEAADA